MMNLSYDGLVSSIFKKDRIELLTFDKNVYCYELTNLRFYNIPLEFQNKNITILHDSVEIGMLQSIASGYEYIRKSSFIGKYSKLKLALRVEDRFLHIDDLDDLKIKIIFTIKNVKFIVVKQDSPEYLFNGPLVY